MSPLAAYVFLTSNNVNANVASSLLSQLNVPNASGKVNKVIGYLSKASRGLNGFDHLSNNYYNNLVSNAANLTNTDTNYPSAYSAYGAITSDASNSANSLSNNDKALENTLLNKNNGSVKSLLTLSVVVRWFVSSSH